MRWADILGGEKYKLSKNNFPLADKPQVKYWKLFFLVAFVVGMFALTTWYFYFLNNKTGKSSSLSLGKHFSSEDIDMADPAPMEEYLAEAAVPEAPTASPAPGSISTSINVTFSTTTEEATICRGLPFGNEPGTSNDDFGTLCFPWNYSSSFKVYPGDIYKLITVKNGVSSSIYAAAYPKIAGSAGDSDTEEQAKESAKALNLQAEEYADTLNSGSEESAKALNSKVDKILEGKDIKSLNSEEKVKDFLNELAN